MSQLVSKSVSEPMSESVSASKSQTGSPMCISNCLLDSEEHISIQLYSNFFPFKEMYLKMSFAKWLPHCLVLNVSTG